MAAPTNPKSTSGNHQNQAAYKILERAHSSDQAKQIYSEKLQYRPLLLAPSHSEKGNSSVNTIKQSNTSTVVDSTRGGGGGGEQTSRALRRYIRLRKKKYYLQHQKPRPLSAKEKRQLGLFKLHPSEIKYHIYRGLHNLWRGYIFEVLGISDPKTGLVSHEVLNGKRQINVANHGSLLASADFHGMEIEVVQSVDVGRVGLKGIVVRETKSSLVVVTKKDKVTTVLKRGTIFKVEIDISDTNGDDGDCIEDKKQNISLASTSHVDMDSKEIQEVKDQGDGGGGGGGGDGNNNNSHKSNQSTSLPSSTPKRKITIELYGSQLEFRPVDRATRKFKWKVPDHL